MFCALTHKFYIKYGNDSFYYVVYSKLKPIDYEAFFKHKELSSSLVSIKVSIIAAKKNTILLPQLLQVSRINIMKFQEKIIVEWTSRRSIRLLWYFHRPSIFIIQKYVDLIDKYDGKPQWRRIYEVSDYLFFEKFDYFNDEFLKHCERNTNIMYFLPSETKKILKVISLQGGLYSQVVMIWSSIVKIKVMN